MRTFDLKNLAAITAFRLVALLASRLSERTEPAVKSRKRGERRPTDDREE